MIMAEDSIRINNNGDNLAISVKKEDHNKIICRRVLVRKNHRFGDIDVKADVFVDKDIFDEPLCVQHVLADEDVHVIENETYTVYCSKEYWGCLLENEWYKCPAEFQIVP